MLVLAITVLVITITLTWRFYASFEQDRFLILAKGWSSTTELVHEEIETTVVCDQDSCVPVTDTDIVVDARVVLSGGGLDPITYHGGFIPGKDQWIRTDLDSFVILESEGGGWTKRQSVNEATYNAIPLGSHCWGEVSWFRYVRRINCRGR